jgi:hypothetical protein
MKTSRQPLLRRAAAVSSRRILAPLCLGLVLAAGRAASSAAATASDQAASQTTTSPAPAPATPAAPPASSAQGATTPSTSAAPSTPTQGANPPTTPAPATATPATATQGTAPPATAAPAAPAQGTTAPSGKSEPSKKGKGKTKDTGKTTKPVKPPPPPPKPPVANKELLRLKPFTGSWTCVGRTYGPGPDHPTAATWSFTWQSDGFWLEARYEELRGVATNPVPVSSTALWVFDDLLAGVSSLSVDNIGGSASQLAPGWVGEKLIFEGPGHRYTTQFIDRDTYVLHGDGQFLHLQEANVNDSWIKLHDDTCTRTAAK